MFYQALWKNRLQYKFANARKREDQHVEMVVSRKRKRPEERHIQPQKQGGPPQWGMINYQPERPSSEDDASIQIHVEYMKLERSKKKPNYDRVAISMAATLADRRRLITKEMVSIPALKTSYPWLFDEEEVCSKVFWNFPIFCPMLQLPWCLCLFACVLAKNHDFTSCGKRKA